MGPLNPVPPSGVDEVGAAQHVLDSLRDEGDTDLQELVDLVRNLCQVDLAAISIQDGDNFQYLITSGADPLVCPSSETMCAQMMNEHGPVSISDVSEDPRFANSPYVDGTIMALRQYGSAPIYAAERTMIGRLCVFAFEVGELTPLQQKSLSTLASSVTSVLELRLRRENDAQRHADNHAASEEVLRVAAQISHDMRIPLTALTTSLDMLDESHPPDMDPVRLRVFGSARRSAQRISRMVEGILRLNDVERSLRIADVDLAKTAHQVIADTGQMLTDAAAVVHVDDLPMVKADGAQMYSLLLNLISNAVKFARPGVPPVMRLHCSPVPGAWRISITDNGTGIPADKRAEVFAMFSRLNTSVEGHGIGLATVARIIHAHQGRVGIDDALVHGTEVWFELPRESE